MIPCLDKCNKIKDLELRSTWVFWVGPEFNDKRLCSCETHTEENKTQGTKQCGDVGTDWRVLAINQGSLEMWMATRSWKRQGRTSPYSREREDGPALATRFQTSGL